MAAVAKNPFEKTWEKEEKHYSKVIAGTVKDHLRSSGVQKKLDAKFKTSNAAEMLDWNNKNISTATALFRKEADAKLAKLMKGYPGMSAETTLSVGKEKKKFLPDVTVKAHYKRVYCGGQKHRRKEKETLREISLKYYGSEIYWETIEQFNYRQMLFGQMLDIPRIYVPENHANTGAKPKSGGTAHPSKMMLPEFSYALEATMDSVHTTIQIAGVPFTIHLTIQTTGTLNVARKGQLPLKFDLKKYTASAEKACKGVNFKVEGSSKKESDLLTLTISGANGAWAVKIAMKDGHTFKLKAPSKKVKYEKDGYVMIGEVGMSIEGKVKPSGGGHPITVPQAPWYMLPFTFAAGAALFLMTRGGLNPATSGLLINQGGSGLVPYDPNTSA